MPRNDLHQPEKLKILGGVDSLSLDIRKFEPTREDIERVCRFFSIGKLLQYEKEKGIIISHSNFFVFAATTQGQYALKFYPPDTAKTITAEYAINRILAHHHFPAPVMHAGLGGRPFIASNGRLATCHTYIKGLQAWQHIKQRNTFPKINAAMLSLKNILSAHKEHIPVQKQANLLTGAGSLAQDSSALAPYDQKEKIDATLQDLCLAYKDHQRLFTRQLVHNNITLTNILVFEGTVYTLDLSHIREDYALCDLASLVISCLFFELPATTIKPVVKNYFTRHKIRHEYFPVLNTLVKIGLIREYLKNIRREKSIGLSVYPQDLAHTYLSCLSKRKKSIFRFLQPKAKNDLP